MSLGCCLPRWRLDSLSTCLVCCVCSMHGVNPSKQNSCFIIGFHMCFIMLVKTQIIYFPILFQTCFPDWVYHSSCSICYFPTTVFKYLFLLQHVFKCLLSAHGFSCMVVHYLCQNICFIVCCLNLFPRTSNWEGRPFQGESESSG